MKPFDLKAAMNGEPVCTADGREVILHAFDAPLTYNSATQPIVGCIKASGEWLLTSWCANGALVSGCVTKSDLRMVTKKTTRYIVSYLNGTEFGVHPTYDLKKAESLAAEYRANKFTNVEITKKVVEL